MKRENSKIWNRIRTLTTALTAAGCLAAAVHGTLAVQAADIRNTEAVTEVTVGVTEKSTEVSLELPLYVTIGVTREENADAGRSNRIIVPEGYGIRNNSYETQDVIVTDIQVAPYATQNPDGSYSLSDWKIVNQVDDTLEAGAADIRQVSLKIGGVQIPTLDPGTQAAPAKMKSIWGSSVASAEKSQFFDKTQQGVQQYPIIGKDSGTPQGTGMPGTTYYKIEADVPKNFLPAANGEGGDNYTAGILKIRYTFSVLVDDGQGNKVIQSAGRYEKREEYTGPDPVTP